MTFKFIRITEINGGGVVDTHLNARYIASFKIGKKGQDTLVVMGDGKWLFVKESPTQIRGLIDG